MFQYFIHYYNFQPPPASTTTKTAHSAPTQSSSGRSSRKKNKGKPLDIPTLSADDDGEDFELTSGSRAYKKIRGQYGGEIPAKTRSVAYVVCLLKFLSNKL